MTSDSVRFSVEVLLYYAPRFDEAGATLSQVSTAVQRRVWGLGGGFWVSCAVEGFFATYPPARPLPQVSRNGSNKPPKPGVISPPHYAPPGKTPSTTRRT